MKENTRGKELHVAYTYDSLEYVILKFQRIFDRGSPRKQNTKLSTKCLLFVHNISKTIDALSFSITTWENERKPFTDIGTTTKKRSYNYDIRSYDL
ncbi:Hypothetical predicted protein [Octopus vulgaris]|uniref:Uncharacterized protein n=1 Tax=Octopus vulgaris TaxID=6645 RepID=A0AA36BR33_OCTVU|nr:Hypothetical predicted protein [Octopus vulgaris]